MNIINKNISSRHIKQALQRMNTGVNDSYIYDYGDDYVLNQDSYFIREIENDLYIETLETLEPESLQKIICDNKDYFLALLELEIVKSEVNNYKEILKQHNL